MKDKGLIKILTRCVAVQNGLAFAISMCAKGIFVSRRHICKNRTSANPVHPCNLVKAFYVLGYILQYLTILPADNKCLDPTG